MAIARGNLYFGQLADAKADIYSPTSLDAMVHLIMLHNTNTTAEDVELLYHDGTSEYLFLNYEMAANETFLLQFRNNRIIIRNHSLFKH